MSEGCIGCLPGKSEQDSQLATITKEAQAHAKKNKESVAIYKDEEGRYKFINAFTAYRSGYPVTTVVSKPGNDPNE